MAGNYPDVPGPRMAYDRDGTVGFVIDPGNSITELTPTELLNLNDESDGTAREIHSYTAVFSGPWTIGLVFPELRDLVGYFFAIGGGSDGPHLPVNFEWSPDTTNGYDGTWTTVGASVVRPQLQPYYRDNIEALSLTGVKGVRFKQTSANFDTYRVGSIQIFGTISSGESPDRLRLWHPTDDAEVGGAYFDWGNVPQGTTATKNFRVKNNSAGLTANAVQVSLDVTTDTTPTVISQHSLRYDGGSFADTIDVGDLAPGGISLICGVKRTTPSDAFLGLWVARILAQASTWS